MTGNQEEERNRESNFASVLRGRFSGDAFSAVKLLADRKWHLASRLYITGQQEPTGDVLSKRSRDEGFKPFIWHFLYH